MKQVTANTFLIGAQKAGTTFFAALLDQVGDICVADPKEPHYFTWAYEKGPDFYSACFKDPGAPVRIDASTTYSVLRPRHLRHLGPEEPGVNDPIPERILDVSPDARFLYILRDPVARAASACRHNFRTRPEPEGPISLLEQIRLDPMLAVGSRYADQIERYLEVVDKNRFLFIDFRDLSADPIRCLETACSFLGVSSEGVSVAVEEGKKHKAFRPTRAGKIVGRLRDHAPALVDRAKAILPAGLRSQISSKILKKPSAITFSDLDEARVLFEEDLRRVRVLTGMEF